MKTGSAQRTRPRSWGGASWAIVLALAATPVLLQAQQTGIVVGIVTDGATGQPLSSAAISIAGTLLGGLTDGRGRFIIRGVQSGPATVRAQRLG
jgi:hypothetical protein